MLDKHPSLAQQNARLLALVFILIELLTAAAIAAFVMVPIARRSTNDLANLMILSAQTWGELPPETRLDFELELARNYQLVLRATADASASPDLNEWHAPYFYFLESALNEKTRQVRHLTRETIGGSSWYWRSLPAGESTLSVGIPVDRVGAQPLVAFLVALVVGMILALLTAGWLARRSVVPLARLEAAAERIGRNQKLELLPETGPRELAALAIRFNAMAIQVRDLLSARTTLLAGVSHDLRTPMARMRLALVLLEQQPGPRLIERLEHDIEEMDSLIGKILGLARDLEPEAHVQVDLRALLGDLAAGLPPGRVRVDSASPPIEVPAPLSALRRVLGNLLDNALRYGGSEAVDLVAEQGPTGVGIGVLDRGPGIPLDQLNSVFQPFHRVESSRSPMTGGTGLGLAIVRQLADAHGWTVNLTPRPGGGLEAWLRLPVR